MPCASSTAPGTRVEPLQDSPHRGHPMSIDDGEQGEIGRIVQDVMGLLLQPYHIGSRDVCLELVQQAHHRWWGWWRVSAGREAVEVS
ncbi:hypothetical protein CSH63_23995 [Micromonospora tulbaghiae]|uniref:Uncharacterized protein n=1 Tax=Micromonospora tulbaghiae TaxID=479978 RepID=A0A386WVL8_9ACTN|nr:hypothetical protein CSH63_23995 [Micromonospora tulbaghiae]